MKKIFVPLPDSAATLATEVRGQGPMLVIIQAGAAGIEGSAAIAPYLEQHFTLVSYDRRGLGESRLPEGARATIADHADDVARIISHLQPDGGAFVFGVSIGAIIGLEAVRRHPAAIARLVAQEPAILALLPEPSRTQLRAGHAEVERLFADRGLGAALEAAVKLGEIDPGDREPDAPTAPPPPHLERSLRYFLANDAPAMRMYEPDIAAMHAHRDRIVIAAGESGPHRWVRKVANTLAEGLGQPLTMLPGGHTGYLLRPRAFAGALATLYKFDDRARRTIAHRNA